MLRIALVLIAFSPLPGCAQHAWRRSGVVIDEPHFKIELEQITFEGQPEMLFEHPADISSVVLENAFAGLKYKPRVLFGSADPQLVIDPDYLPLLARSVSEALAQASESERVRFEMREGHRSLYLLPSTTTTRGVAFVSDNGALNIAFDEIRALPEMDEYGTRSSWGNPTRRTRSTGRLDVSEYATHGVSTNGTAMPLWAVMPLSQIPTTRVTPSPAARESKLSANASNSKPDPTTLTDREVLTRLRLLEELYQEGTITEQQYEKKRSELLGTTPKR